MQPNITQYKNALLNTTGATLKNIRAMGLQPVLNEAGEPIRKHGSNSVVFKLTNGTKFFGLKCYIKNVEGLWDYLKQVKTFLLQNPQPNIVPFEIIENEIIIDVDTGSEFLCHFILMPWVPGNNLLIELKNHCNSGNIGAIKQLNRSFSTLATYLVEKPFTHGDIFPTDIIIKPTGEIIFTDHDCISFDGLPGNAGLAEFHLSFQHPARRKGHDRYADHFPILLILVWLQVLQYKPQMFEKFLGSQGFFFKPRIISRLEQSEVYLEIEAIQDKRLHKLVILLYNSFTSQSTRIAGLLDFLHNDELNHKNNLLKQKLEQLTANKKNNDQKVAPLHWEASVKTNTKDLVRLENEKLKQEIERLAYIATKHRKFKRASTAILSTAAFAVMAIIFVSMYYTAPLPLKTLPDQTGSQLATPTINNLNTTNENQQINQPVTPEKSLLIRKTSVVDQQNKDDSTAKTANYLVLPTKQKSQNFRNHTEHYPPPKSQTGEVAAKKEGDVYFGQNGF